MHGGAFTAHDLYLCEKQVDDASNLIATSDSIDESQLYFHACDHSVRDVLVHEAYDDDEYHDGLALHIIGLAANGAPEVQSQRPPRSRL